MAHPTGGPTALRAGTHIEDVVVVVPAHNEEDTVAACLASVDAAAAMVLPLPVHVVVMADDCTDATVDVVRRMRTRAGRVEVSPVSSRRVGAVRAAGFAGRPAGPRTWFATTDADSLVPPSWLVEQLLSAETYDVFAGTVVVEDWSPRPAGLRDAFAQRYHPAAAHRHVHATNLGIRASLYRAVGGFPDVAAHEDLALVTACEAAGALVDWSVAAPVVTSARHSHRTPTGFSDYLTRLETERPA